MEEIMNLITELIYDPARFINNEVEYRKEIEDKINKYKDEAINFAHSSTKLPSKETLTFDEFLFIHFNELKGDNYLRKTDNKVLNLESVIVDYNKCKTK